MCIIILYLRFIGNSVRRINERMKKMKHIKKIFAVILIVTMALTATGCSDLTWSFKTDDTTVSIGTYIFYEYSAFYDASQNVSDSDAQVLDQTIEGTPAEEWIRDKALESVKKYLAVEKLMKDMKLTLTSAETTSADTYTNYIWNSYNFGTEFENYGISKDSYNKAVYLLNAKDEKIFKAIYDKDGTKAVAEDDLKKYFTDNYTDYYYFTYDLTTTDSSSGDSVAMSDADKEKVVKEFDKYLKMVNSEKKSYEDVVNEFIKYSGATSSASKDQSVTEASPSNHHTTILNDSSMLDESVRKKIIDMKENSYDAFIDSEGTDAKYYFVYKTSITERAKEFLVDGDERVSVLRSMKDKEYNSYIDDVIKEIKYETNEKALKKYAPEMFADEFMN